MPVRVANRLPSVLHGTSWNGDATSPPSLTSTNYSAPVPWEKNKPPLCLYLTVRPAPTHTLGTSPTRCASYGVQAPLDLLSHPHTLAPPWAPTSPTPDPHTQSGGVWRHPHLPLTRAPPKNLFLLLPLFRDPPLVGRPAPMAGAWNMAQASQIVYIDPLPSPTVQRIFPFLFSCSYHFPCLPILSIYFTIPLPCLDLVLLFAV